MNYDPKVTAQKARNVAVFRETMSVCGNGVYAAPAGKHVVLPPQRDVLEGARLYVAPPRVDHIPVRGQTLVNVVKEDCMETARKLEASGYSTILLNMADRHTPGGGVLSGSRAQEESLFRRSNLCVSLYQFDDYHAALLDVPTGDGRYPMDRATGGIYSPHIMFFRAGPDKDYAFLDDPYCCAVVSVAAINHPDLKPDGNLADWAVSVTKEKIRTILRIGLLHGHDAIILSAWGCGAFGNPPRHMAKLFHEVIDEREFANKYRRICFSIIENHNSHNANYAAFAEEFAAEPARGEDGLTVFDEFGFPGHLTADMLRDFQTTESGRTHPRCGLINGRRFIAKCGSWSDYSSDGHVQNELVADGILRAAGLAVPASRGYLVHFPGDEGLRIIRLSAYAEGSVPLIVAWNHGGAALRAVIRKQVLDAYPVIAWIAGIDTFTCDNVRVGTDGRLIFVDNGCSFDYRARGMQKGWFWKRYSPEQPGFGYLSLYEHPDKAVLRNLLGNVTCGDLWAAAAKYNFTALFDLLPKQYQRECLRNYSKQLDEMSRQFLKTHLL